MGVPAWLSRLLVPAGSLSSLPKGNPTMSGGLDVLQMKEEDVLKFLAAGTHLGGTNLDFQMEQYIYKRKSDGKPIGLGGMGGQRGFCGHS